MIDKQDTFLSPKLCLRTLQPLKLGHITNKDSFRGVWFREIFCYQRQNQVVDVFTSKVGGVKYPRVDPTPSLVPPSQQPSSE